MRRKLHEELQRVRPVGDDTAARVGMVGFGGGVGRGLSAGGGQDAGTEDRGESPDAALGERHTIRSRS